MKLEGKSLVSLESKRKYAVQNLASFESKIMPSVENLSNDAQNRSKCDLSSFG